MWTGPIQTIFWGGLKVIEIFITERDQLEELQTPKDTIYSVPKEVLLVYLKILCLQSTAGVHGAEW